MIKVRIGNEKSTVINFPCSDNVLNEKLKEIGVGEQIPSRATVTEVLEPKDLPLKLHLIHNLDEMNYLAKRLDSFTPHEMDTFIEMVKSEEYYMPYLSKPFETNTCHIQVEQYGQVDYDLLKQIEKTDINECKKHMTDYDIYYLLWILAIKEPFDYYSYKTLYNTVKKLKFRRGDIPFDAILSSVYVANKHANILPPELCSHYRKEAEYSVCSMKVTQSIINFASMLCWIGDKELEYFVLKKLYEDNTLPNKLQGRFKVLENEIRV